MYTQTSSERYKQDIVNWIPDPSWLMNLQLREFNYKSDLAHGYGLIAEETYDVNPAACTYNTDTPCICGGTPKFRNCGLENCGFIPHQKKDVEGINLEQIVFALLKDYQIRNTQI
jgi:hypothetical protein